MNLNEKVKKVIEEEIKEPITNFILIKMVIM